MQKATKDLSQKSFRLQQEDLKQKPHETWHLKMGHPKRKFIFQPSIFRGYVSFREGNLKFLRNWNVAWKTGPVGEHHPPTPGRRAQAILVMSGASCGYKMQNKYIIVQSKILPKSWNFGLGNLGFLTGGFWMLDLGILDLGGLQWTSKFKLATHT